MRDILSNCQFASFCPVLVTEILWTLQKIHKYNWLEGGRVTNQGATSTLYIVISDKRETNGMLS